MVMTRDYCGGLTPWRKGSNACLHSDFVLKDGRRGLSRLQCQWAKASSPGCGRGPLQVQEEGKAVVLQGRMLCALRPACNPTSAFKASTHLACTGQPAATAQVPGLCSAPKKQSSKP